MMCSQAAVDGLIDYFLHRNAYGISSEKEHDEFFGSYELTKLHGYTGVTKKVTHQSYQITEKGKDLTRHCFKKVYKTDEQLDEFIKSCRISFPEGEEKKKQDIYFSCREELIKELVKMAPSKFY